MIEFKDVTKIYKNNVHALDGVSFHIEKGEFVFLIGASGAGKSTLIRLLLKEINPDSGQIFFNGREITKVPKRLIPPLRREIGVVFQDFRLLQNMTVYENVEYVLNLQGMARKEKKEKVIEVLDLVHLSGRMKSYPNQLSGGEQQRVSIARAMALDPVLLIADEPTGNLDPEISREIMDSFLEINKRGTTLLVSTHEREIVNSMNKRVLQLEGGKLVRDEEEGRYQI